MTDRFPAFGALFQTATVAARDLGANLLSIFIIMLGFVIATTLLIGDDTDLFRTPIKTFLMLFYMTFGQNDRLITINRTPKITLAVQIFYISFIILFFIAFQKLLIAIIIIRYKYLRSVIQISNEAYARISDEKLKVRRQLLFNFIF